MKLWRSVSGAFKDRKSICLSTLSRKTPYHNPSLKIAVIKATSHDQYKVDYKNVQCLLQWLSTSSSYSKPLTNAVSRRMDRTRSWVVALKGLMLMHRVINSNVSNIGKLSFDLSDFMDRVHVLTSVDLSVNALVQSYYSFLYQKSSICGRKRLNNDSMADQLLKLDEMQKLLDKLLRVKPLTEEIMHLNIVTEAMECVTIEILKIYGSICDGIAQVLLRIYKSRREEAKMAMRILKQASFQGDKLREYFKLCRNYGLLNDTMFPNVVDIPEEDIKELENIINRRFEKIVEMGQGKNKVEFEGRGHVKDCC